MSNEFEQSSPEHANATENEEANTQRSHAMIPLKWYVLSVLVLATIAVLALRADPDKQIQRKNIHTAIVILIAAGAMVVWMLALSRWTLRRRGIVVLIVAAAAGGAALTLKIEGVNGDLVPIVTWKWDVQRDGTLDPLNIRTPQSRKQSNHNGKSKNKQPSDIDPVVPGLIDFPQFLGPARNAKLAAPALNAEWMASPPRELWRRPVGAAWSGFAVVGHRAITQEQRGESELVVCYDIRTGEPLWKHEDNARYDTTIGGVGPRATPTIDNGHVYTHGGTGVLNCLDLSTGKEIWSRNTIEDARTALPAWGVAGSPLIVDDMVVINAGPPGGTLLAYERTTGKKRWAVGRDDASYSSPMLANLAGQRQIVILNHTTITGHAVQNGQTLWSHPWPGAQPKVAQPVVLPGDRLFITSGYGVGCEMIRVTKDESSGKFSTSSLFKNIKLRAKFTNVIHHEGFIYGLNDGLLVCLNADTGEWAWRGKRYGHGQLLFVAGVLLIQAERGYIALVNPSPNAFEQVARFEVFDNKTWNNPTLAGKYLLLRNDREAVCLELPIPR